MEPAKTPKEIKDHVWGQVMEHVKKYNIKSFHVVRENRIGSFMMLTNNQSYLVTFQLRGVYLLISLRFPLHVARDENRRDNMSIFLSRINTQLMVGSFRLDHNDGEVSFRHSALIDENLTSKCIKKLMLTSISTVNRYSPMILEQTFSNSNPHENFEKPRQEEVDELISLINGMSTEDIKEKLKSLVELFETKVE